ncbi:MAG: hypothetical protein AMXMBFR7_00150 [Planctomycetota bacterium]
MAVLLFPGRHHALTNYQRDYLARVLAAPRDTLRDLRGRPLKLSGPVDTVLWAVTSANHANTRRNPLPAHHREVAIELFALGLPGKHYVYLVDDVGRSPRFAEYVVKKIEVESRGRFRLAPENCVVGCSTPEVLAQYETLGFQILPVELEALDPPRFAARTPWELLTECVDAGLNGADFRATPAWQSALAPATRDLFEKYAYPEMLLDLFRDPLLGDDGDLTATRDYNTYVRSFDEGAPRKYEIVKPFMLPGRIVDVGCCTGSVIREMTLDERLDESDFYGIEVARHLHEECLHRKEQGHFANEHVFFYRRNAAQRGIFPPHSVNVFTTFSLTHELESYQGRGALTGFLRLLFEQLAPGGRWLNVDVVGPEDGGREVRLWLDAADGRNGDWERAFPADARDELRAYLDGLSTAARFLRFARDYRAAEGYALPHRYEDGPAGRVAVLALRDACEFLSKKDYTDNWQSEMHETFCFWSFADWTRAAEAAGFRIHPGSRAYANPWSIRNRYEGRARLYERRGDALEPIPWPPTNLLLVAEKP